MNALQGRRVLLGVGGGIAAYKLCEVASSLAKEGISVRAVLTSTAQNFVTKLTFSTLCRQAAYSDEDFWDASHPRPLHIELGEWAEVLAIGPLTANTLAKLAWGMADNLLTNTVLASTCPILLVPAMNTDMWNQPTVQENLQRLQSFERYRLLEPEAGLLACDRVGTGRMAEPSAILAYLHSLLQGGTQQDLVGKQVVVSGGSTREFLDPVRFIGNPSTGKMGLALAQAAYHRGASVTFVHGPMDPALLTELPRQYCQSVTNADEMLRALLAASESADWILMSAAVADAKPATYSPTKLPKAALPDSIPLAPVPDILAELAKYRRSSQRLIGFAAQTGDIVPPAQRKLEAKGIDAIAANPIDRPHAGFGSDENQAILLDKYGRQQTIPPCTKLQLAHHLLDFIQSIPVNP